MFKDGGIYAVNPVVSRYIVPVDLSTYQFCSKATFYTGTLERFCMESFRVGKRNSVGHLHTISSVS